MHYHLAYMSIEMERVTHSNSSVHIWWTCMKSILLQHLNRYKPWNENKWHCNELTCSLWMDMHTNKQLTVKKCFWHVLWDACICNILHMYMYISQHMAVVSYIHLLTVSCLLVCMSIHILHVSIVNGQSLLSHNRHWHFKNPICHT